MTNGVTYTSTKPLEEFECNKKKKNTVEETISILSDIRSGYNCFNENEEPKYRALSKAIEALKDAPDTNVGWIPCGEGLPKLGQKVLASTKRTVFTQVFKGVWNGKHKDWIWENNTAKSIVAWMPLPEPYGEDINVPSKGEEE